jgi:hypothetical protein
VVPGASPYVLPISLCLSQQPERSLPSCFSSPTFLLLHGMGPIFSCSSPEDSGVVLSLSPRGQQALSFPGNSQSSVGSRAVATHVCHTALPVLLGPRPLDSAFPGGKGLEGDAAPLGHTQHQPTGISALVLVQPGLDKVLVQPPSLSDHHPQGQ